MFQYGYADFQQNGYQFASENAFFHSGLLNRKTKLAQLVNHVDTAQHTAYTATEPVAYLGIFTDLDSNQETPRYYFQKSGRIKARNASYAQGYVESVENEEERSAFFQKTLLRLLGAPFLNGEALTQLPSSDCDRYFPDIEAEKIEPCLTPAVLDHGLLLHVLNEMLRGHRLILHIDCQGDEAPDYSRRILLRIYECLPYAVRCSRGFATNVAPERFSTTIESDRLPGAVQLCLVDGDVTLPSRVSGFVTLDMRQNYSSEDLGNNLEFLEMLTTNSVTRKHFFDIVQENYGDNNASMEEYRTMYELESDLELPCGDEAIRVWAEDYRKLPKITSTICRRVSERLNLSAAEKALCHAELPELKNLSELARSEKLSVAWELRMFSTIYAAQDDSIRALADALTGEYLSRCAKEISPLRRGLPFATAESSAQLQLYSQMRLEDALKLPSKYKENRIVEQLASKLPSAIKKIAESESKSYQDQLESEQRRVAAMVPRCKNLAQLVRFYQYLCTPECAESPLCCYAVTHGESFSDAASYGPDCWKALVDFVAAVILPTRLNDMKAFAADVDALTNSELYQRVEIHNASSAAVTLVGEYRILADVVRKGSASSKIRAMADLAQGTGKLSHLPEEMRAESIRILQEGLRTSTLTPDDLFVCTPELQTLQIIDTTLLPVLLNNAGLLRVDINDTRQTQMLLEHGPQWIALCGPVNCRTTFEPADLHNNRPKIELTVRPEAMLEALRWRCTDGPVPKLMQFLTEEAPDWLLKEYASEPARIASILRSITPCTVKNRMVQELMWRPMPSAQVGNVLVRELKKSGLTEQEMRQLCDSSWGGIIFTQYFDPSQGDYGSAIRTLRKELGEFCQKANAIHAEEAKLDQHIKERQNKIISTRSRMLGKVLAVFFAVYGILPLLALMATKQLVAEAAAFWLFMELITAAILLSVGVLMSIGLENQGKYIRCAAGLGCLGLMPGILTAAALMLFL